MPEPRLTTTAYAILGVLAIKPRTAYELAAEMRHCFEYIWPRADVRVYADAKELAAKGLVASERTMVGRRPRTAYAITPKGRAALRRWLARPSRPVALEFEGLLKVYLARFGTLDQLRSTVAQVGQDADYMLQVATNVRHVYLTGCAPFQEDYVHVWAFVYDFLQSWFKTLSEWARRTSAELEGWQDLKPAEKARRAMEIFERHHPAPELHPDFEALLDGVPAMPGMWHSRGALPPDSPPKAKANPSRGALPPDSPPKAKANPPTRSGGRLVKPRLAGAGEAAPPGAG